MLDQAPAFDAALRASVEYAFAHPTASRDYVRQHAQELDDRVTQSHIDLYVNKYTIEIDQTAVDKFVEFSARHRVGQ